MGLKHVRTDDCGSPGTNTRTRLLTKVLSRHAVEGFDVFELRRPMGKGGYVPEHRWEDDGSGDALTDDDGSVILIGGMSPAKLAADVIETARQRAEQTGERKSYRLVGLRRVEGEDGNEEEDEVFQFLLPATMFSGVRADPIPAPTPERHEYHDALMAANVQLQRQNDALFRVLMDVIRQYPTILGKSAELLQQLGDQLGGGRQHDLQQVLSILEHESTREQRWMEHDITKQRSNQRAEIFGKTIDVAGPDLMVLLRRAVETVMQAAQQRAAAEPAPAANEPPRTEGTDDERTRAHSTAGPCSAAAWTIKR